MKRTLPLMIALVLMLAPAAWGYDVSIVGTWIGPSLSAQVGFGSGIGIPQPTAPDPLLYESQRHLATATNGDPPLQDTASSDWLIKVYEPVVTWVDPVNHIGKITTLKQSINVSMLISIISGYGVTGACGTQLSPNYTNLITFFSATPDNPSGTPIVNLDVAWNGTSNEKNITTWLYHQTDLFSPPEEIIYQANNTVFAPGSLATQTPDADGLAVLLAYTDGFNLELDLSTYLTGNGLPLLNNPDVAATYANNALVTEILTFIEPDFADPDFVPAPVPPSLLLFGSGLMGLGFMIRRRRQS